MARAEASLAKLERDLAPLSGPALLEHILEDIPEFKSVVFDQRSLPLIMAGMEAAWWLNDQLGAWLGERNAADTLTQSVPGNVTSEMGLALLDVADAIRPYPEVVAFLRTRRRRQLPRPTPGLAGGARRRSRASGRS